MPFTTIGLYRDDTFKINGVKPEHLIDHINYNKVHRPGRALFLEGKCIYQAGFSSDVIKKFEEKIKDIKMEKVTIPYN